MADLVVDGWERIKPQWVRHTAGYQVCNDGPYRVAYEDDRGRHSSLPNDWSGPSSSA